jgi:hypothetical protein
MKAEMTAQLVTDAGAAEGPTVCRTIRTRGSQHASERVQPLRRIFEESRISAPRIEI